MSSSSRADQRGQQRTVAVKLDAKLARQAKVIAAQGGSTAAKVLSDAARPTIERQYQAALRSLAETA